MANPVVLRMDDVGASSKKYEIYSNRQWKAGPLRISGNWLFLKYLPSVRAWGPYRELGSIEWEEILALLQKYKAKLTVAVTATWVASMEKIKPFPLAFPRQAEIIKDAAKEKVLEVANHGLTHSVVEGNAFRPRLFDGNREFHREFGPGVPASVQADHIARSQDILQSWLGMKVVSFVPPGNQFTEKTLELAAKHGLKYVSCNTPARLGYTPMVLGNKDTVAFHDRDIVLGTKNWLEDLLAEHKTREFLTVSELAEERLSVYGN